MTIQQKQHQAWIALGGNLGDIQQNFQSARQHISTHPACQLLQSSRLYQTPPLGPDNQPDYLNAVIAIETTLQPLELLQLLQHIEHLHGRVRKQHWGARTLDLDILAYDQLQQQNKTLTLPHEHLCVRQFVLRPLSDIAPNWLHPSSQKSVYELLQHVINTDQQVLEDGIVW